MYFRSNRMQYDDLYSYIQPEEIIGEGYNRGRVLRFFCLTINQKLCDLEKEDLTAASETEAAVEDVDDL